MIPKDKYEGVKLQNQLCFAIYSTAHAFSAAYKPMLDRIGVTYPQYLVLMVLWEHDGPTVSEIGSRLELDSGTLTPILKRLEKTGLLTRQRDQSDERMVRIKLTSRGHEAKHIALTGRNDLVCSIGLRDDKLQALKKQVDHLRAALRSLTTS
jgi:DNA-binding MarR family transcriptional regulator